MNRVNFDNLIKKNQQKSDTNIKKLTVHIAQIWKFMPCFQRHRVAKNGT